MPEFVLRYKLPSRLTLDYEIEDYIETVTAMAEQVRIAVSNVFFGWEVAFEIREFGRSCNQPDFAVTGWVTQRESVTLELVQKAQSAALEAMQKYAHRHQFVECWWQMVQGKWSQAQGLL
jgi:hypothetical protein